MHITIISGSQRSSSSSIQIANRCKSIIQDANHDCDIIDLSTNILPYRSDTNNPDTPEGQKIRQAYAEKLNKADGIIVISPERSGMATPHIKNFFLWCDGGEIAHKPGLIIGVSSGTGGAYPIAELRMSSYKNTKICYIPDHMIIRDVQNILEDVSHKYREKIYIRLTNTINTLLAYMLGFITIRDQKIIQDDPMPYGM